MLAGHFEGLLFSYFFLHPVFTELGAVIGSATLTPSISAIMA
jgi:hypothetical protein